MCGINGLINYGGRQNASLINEMNKAIAHRGPDGIKSEIFGFKTKKTAIALGHVRLSLIDLSHASDQPLSIMDGKYTIVFNGEIFNYKELRNELMQDGIEFKSQGDTEVLLWLYAKHKESCLDKLRGFFAFCIYDKEEQKLFLARDRCGVKPLKYFYDGKTFAFSSEIKALLKLDYIPKQVDIDAVKDFLSLKYIPAPRTILKDVRKLQAGHLMYFDLNTNTLDIQNYYTPKFEPKLKLSYVQAYEQTIALLKESVKYRLVSDAPIGIFLSGGIDSSIVAQMACEVSSDKLKSFCVGFPDAKFDERKYAKTVAEQFGLEHYEIELDIAAIQSDIQDIIANYDEPFADPSIIPTHYLSKFASSKVKAALGGDGGDELFGGYKRYTIHKRNAYQDFLPQIVKDLSFLALSISPAKANKHKGWGKLNRALESLSLDYIQSYALRFGGFGIKAQSLMLRTPLQNSNKWNNDILKLLGKTDAKNAVDRLMALDQITFLPEYILTKTDISTMANHIEGREPLLDSELASFVNLLPINYKHNKRILKDYLSDKLPKDIIYRKKAGFNPPMQLYSESALKSFMSHYMLSSDSGAAFINAFAREKLWLRHTSKEANNAELIWSICVLGAWLDAYDIRVDF